MTKVLSFNIDWITFTIAFCLLFACAMNFNVLCTYISFLGFPEVQHVLAIRNLLLSLLFYCLPSLHESVMHEIFSFLTLTDFNNFKHIDNIFMHFILDNILSFLTPFTLTVLTAMILPARDLTAATISQPWSSLLSGI